MIRSLSRKRVPKERCTSLPPGKSATALRNARVEKDRRRMPSMASNCVTQGTPGSTILQIVGKKVIIGWKL